MYAKMKYTILEKGEPDDDYRPDHLCGKPATNIPHTSAAGRAVVAERQLPDTFAYQLLEHVGHVHGDENADLYLARVVAELFELSPIVREHVSDLIIADLSEELHRHGQAGKDAARVVGVVQRDWMNERG